MNRRFYKHHIVGNEARWPTPMVHWRKHARRPRRGSRLFLAAGLALLALVLAAGLLIG